MKSEILSNLSNPSALEKLYRSNKAGFARSFNEIYPEIQSAPAADFWNERLHFRVPSVSGTEIIFIVAGAILAGIMAKLPAFTGMDEEFFYSRNIGFILFPILTAYFAWKNKIKLKTMVFLGVVFTASALYINMLPATLSDTLILSCIHMVLFLWFVTETAFSAESGAFSRIEYLRFTGDLVIMSGLIALAGGVLSAITLALFSLIGLDIERFYFENIIVFALPAIPILGSYLTKNNPALVGKISPVIAKIFSPLVLIMLVIYLAAILYLGKDPYNDREFLMLFNLLLIGVMAIIFFSVSDVENDRVAGTWILFLLSALTILINSIALSAILFRISEWGITPNRAAVLGANFLVLVNLLLVSHNLFKVLRNRAGMDIVRKTIAAYLPVYFIWVAIVTFLFPLIFGS